MRQLVAELVRQHVASVKALLFKGRLDKVIEKQGWVFYGFCIRKAVIVLMEIWDPREATQGELQGEPLTAVNAYPGSRCAKAILISDHTGVYIITSAAAAAGSGNRGVAAHPLR